MNAMQEIVEGKGFSVKVIRTNRIKSATVKVVDGEVSVVVPRNLSCESVQSLVVKKTKWINEKLLLQKNHVPYQLKEYVSGECFQYLGKNYRLKIHKGPEQAVKLASGMLIVQVPDGARSPPNLIRGALGQWYIEKATAKLTDKTQRFSKLLRLHPKSLAIGDFKSQWGSCTQNGDVRLNWQIIIAPNRIVDYVVVHELCHLLHHNHSQEFWRTVGNVLPEYRDCREWLRVNGCRLKL